MIEVLDRIPLELEAEQVTKWLGARGRDESIERMVRELLEAALPAARPKAVYAVAGVENRTDDSLEIDGVCLTSRVLRINLDETHRVFPYVATCGRELDDIVVPPDDILGSYCLDVIKMMALGAAMAHLASHLTRRYQPGELSHMNPGSIESWPIEQQKELFSILGDVEGAIGVTLTDSLVMVPQKSTSGIYFPTETGFQNCQLCPREKCVGRRAPYDPELVGQYEETPEG